MWFMGLHLLTNKKRPEYTAWTKTDDFKKWQLAHGNDSTCKALIKIQYLGKRF